MVKNKKPMWPSTFPVFGHVGLLCNEPPGAAELLFVSSSNVCGHHCMDEHAKRHSIGYTRVRAGSVLVQALGH